MATKISTIRKHFSFTSNENTDSSRTKNNFQVQQTKTSGALLARCRGQACDATPVRTRWAERNILNLFNCKRQSGPHSDFGIAP